MTSCGAIGFMSAEKMEKLKLGMSRQEVTSILGSSYSVAENYKEGDHEIKVLAYQFKEQIYFFIFKDDKLQEWHRKIDPFYVPPQDSVAK